MRRSLLIALLLAFSLCAAKAKAATITYNISFTAYGQIAASGYYTLTLDPTQTYIDATSGLTANSFSDGLAAPSPLAFTYTPSGYLDIGGALNGAHNVVAGTDDYLVEVGYLTTANPTLLFFVATSAGSPNRYYTDTYGMGTVTVSQSVAATPEPSSLALLGSGLLGVVGLVRKRIA